MITALKTFWKMAKKFELPPLLACPLCAKEPKIRKQTKYTIYCNGNREKPHILGTDPLGHETEFAARNAWNNLIQTITVTDPTSEDTENNGTP